MYDDFVGEGEGRAPAGRIVVSGLGRYRALLAHIMAHRHWSSPQIAENYGPLQRMAIEVFEDCRVEQLAIRDGYPGLRTLWRHLHPVPREDCSPRDADYLAQQLLHFPLAVLDPETRPQMPLLREALQHFQTLMARPGHETRDVIDLAIAYLARLRRDAGLGEDS